LIIGVPKEIKMDEMRVSVVPSGVEALVSAGHRVLVERSAGAGAGFLDQAYEQAGAELIVDGQAVWGLADLIVKVKEPLPSEYELMRAEQIIFTFLHLAAVPELAAALAHKKAVAVAYETIQQPDRSLPLLEPMSEIAGKMSVQVGARLLEKTFGGRGVLLGGVPGVAPADVVIIGAGTVGLNAARIALGMGAQVSMLDLNVQKMRMVYDLFDGRVITSISNNFNIAKAVRHADLLVGAVLIPGAKAPRLVSEEMVKTMKNGAVIIDVAIDQGGIVETIDRITTHSSPTYLKHGVLHYAVPNMPGAVPRTSTFALTNVTFPYLFQLANMGYKQAFAENPVLAAGANLVCGCYTHPDVAQALSQVYTPLSSLI